MKNVAFALAWLAASGVLSAFMALAAESSTSGEAGGTKASALPKADAILTKIRDSRYDLAAAGLIRAAAYIRAPEIQATLDPAVRSILRRTRLEAIFVPHKPVEVKTRKTPSELTAEGRIGVEIYRSLIEAGLRHVTGGLDFAYNIIDPEKMLVAFDAVVDSGDDGTVEIMLQKKKTRPIKDEDNPAAREYITIIVGKDGLLQRVVSVEKGVRTEIGIGNYKHKDRWLFKSVDIAKSDAEGRFLERAVIEIDYLTVKGIALPSKISYRALDKDGKPLQRRNEANPVSVEFSDYEVEK